MAAVLSGCGGSNTGPGAPLAPNANLLALVGGNQLLSFNSTSIANLMTRQVTGLGAGETLVSIDYRFAPQAGGVAGLYGLTRTNGNVRLYRLDISGAGNIVATPVSGAVTPPVLDSANIDFNPVPDRIRLVSTNRVNLRLHPDTGQLVDSDPVTPGRQDDGTLTYANGDVNAGAVPRIVGVAYTNNDNDAATGTINYGLDSSRDVLVTQGRPDDPGTAADESVSPNTGLLFTVGNLAVDFSDSVGFDIGSAANTAFILGIPVSGVRPVLYTVNLTTGRASQVTQRLNTTEQILDLAIVP